MRAVKRAWETLFTLGMVVLALLWVLCLVVEEDITGKQLFDGTHPGDEPFL